MSTAGAAHAAFVASRSHHDHRSVATSAREPVRPRLGGRKQQVRDEMPEWREQRVPGRGNVCGRPHPLH